MNEIEAILSSNYNKKGIEQIVAIVKKQPNTLENLMALFLGHDYRISQKASWAVGRLGDLEPNLLALYHKRLVKSLSQSHKHDAIRRNVVRIYQTAEIPEEIEGELYETCFQFLLSQEIPVAIRVFSMTVCYRITEKHPVLARELAEAIKAHLEHAKPAYISRARKTLKMLAKLEAIAAEND